MQYIAHNRGVCKEYYCAINNKKPRGETISCGCNKLVKKRLKLKVEGLLKANFRAILLRAIFLLLSLNLGGSSEWIVLE